MKTENIKQAVRILWQGFWVAAMIMGLTAGNGLLLWMFPSKEEAVKTGFLRSGQNRIKKRIRLSTPQRAAIGKLSTQVVRDKAMSFLHWEKRRADPGIRRGGRVKNRSWTISYMVVMNTDGSVKDVEVLNYEGARGVTGASRIRILVEAVFRDESRLRFPVRQRYYRCHHFGSNDCCRGSVKRLRLSGHFSR